MTTVCMCVDVKSLIPNTKSLAMKNRTLLPFVVLSAILASCSPQGGGEDYDISNPYAAPDYGDGSGTPYQPSDVNPVYDAAAVYEDTAPVAAPRATVHTVVGGDSLWKIGNKYGVSVNAIKKANGLTRDTAVLGAKLKIPAQ